MTTLTKAIPADRQPKAEEWRTLHQVADQMRPKLMNAFLETAEVARRSTSFDAIENALISGSIPSVQAAIVWPEDNFRVQFAALLLTTFTTAGGAIGGGIQKASVNIAFDATNPRAVEFAETQSAARVTGITTETRKAIQTHLARSLDEGVTPRDLARELRSIIGLNERQANSVVNLRRTLVERDTDPERIQRLVDRQSARLLRHRAETIARTEGMEAVSAGQHELFRQARDQGLLDESTIRRIPIVTPDDRLCPICRPIPSMNPKGVGLEQPFQTPVGPKMHSPFHVRCRCSQGLRTIENIPDTPPEAPPRTGPVEIRTLGDAHRMGDSQIKALNLTAQERRALEAYKIEEFTLINVGLRKDRLFGRNKTFVREMDNAFARAATDRPLTVYRGGIMRGLTPPPSPSLIGQEIVDNGFISTSFNKELAGQLAKDNVKGVLFKIKVPQGSKGIYTRISFLKTQRQRSANLQRQY